MKTTLGRASPDTALSYAVQHLSHLQDHGLKSCVTPGDDQVQTNDA